jgi:hypothetical protein
MTPRLAELVAAMVEAVLVAETAAVADRHDTIRNAAAQSRAPKRVAQEERSESCERG